MNGKKPLAFVLCACFALLLVTAPRATSAAEAPGVLFPVAFTVEHALVQTDADGSQFRTDAVTDTYGGSHLVSVRPGGSRVIVDFARREITEVSAVVDWYGPADFAALHGMSEIDVLEGLVLHLCAASSWKDLLSGANPR